MKVAKADVNPSIPTPEAGPRNPPGYKKWSPWQCGSPFNHSCGLLDYIPQSAKGDFALATFQWREPYY